MDSHEMAYSVSADRSFGLFNIFTLKGFTVKIEKKITLNDLQDSNKQTFHEQTSMI